MRVREGVWEGVEGLVMDGVEEVEGDEVEVEDIVI